MEGTPDPDAITYLGIKHSKGPGKLTRGSSYMCGPSPEVWLRPPPWCLLLAEASPLSSQGWVLGAIIFGMPGAATQGGSSSCPSHNIAPPAGKEHKAQYTRNSKAPQHKPQ